MPPEAPRSQPEQTGADGLDPRRCDAFQLVRRLECAATDRPRVGQSLFPSEETVAFGQTPSLAFATSTVGGVHDERGRRKVILNAFGLLGPNGPLPLHLTEYVRERLTHHHDPTLLHFLDLLTTRLAAHFYRAWAINQAAAWHDRPDDDRFAFYLRCLVGLGTRGLGERERVPDAAKLFLAGHHATLPRNAEGIGCVLADWFDVPCAVEQMVGHWMRLPPRTWARVSRGPGTVVLGRTATIGRRVWDAHQSFRVRLGPLAFDDYENLLPDAPGHGQVLDLVRFHAGLEHAWSIRLVLRAQEVPAARLGEAGRLGYTAWLGGGGGQDRDDLIMPAA